MIGWLNVWARQLEWRLLISFVLMEWKCFVLYNTCNFPSFVFFLYVDPPLRWLFLSHAFVLISPSLFSVPVPVLQCPCWFSASHTVHSDKPVIGRSPGHLRPVWIHRLLFEAPSALIEYVFTHVMPNITQLKCFIHARQDVVSLHYCWLQLEQKS